MFLSLVEPCDHSPGTAQTPSRSEEGRGSPRWSPSKTKSLYMWKRLPSCRSHPDAIPKDLDMGPVFASTGTLQNIGSDSGD